MANRSETRVESDSLASVEIPVNALFGCINGIRADERRSKDLAEASLSVTALLTPHIGYDRAAAVADEARRRRQSVREVAHELTGIDVGKLGQS